MVHHLLRLPYCTLLLEKLLSKNSKNGKFLPASRTGRTLKVTRFHSTSAWQQMAEGFNRYNHFIPTIIRLKLFWTFFQKTRFTLMKNLPNWPNRFTLLIVKQESPSSYVPSFKRSRHKKRKKRKKKLCDSWHSKSVKREQDFDLAEEEEQERVAMMTRMQLSEIICDKNGTVTGNVSVTLHEPLLGIKSTLFWLLLLFLFPVAYSILINWNDSCVEVNSTASVNVTSVNRLH